MKSCERGRSMIEMLGVLAIVGVLSVGGIAGYTKAMAKFKNDKLINQLGSFVMNIRSVYANQNTFENVSNELLLSIGAVPAEMYSQDEVSLGIIRHAWGGEVIVFPSETSDGKVLGFELYAMSISRESCISIATMDWGSDPASGFRGLYVGVGAVEEPQLLHVFRASDSSPETGIFTPGQHTEAVPMTVLRAISACNCNNLDCTIGLKYL